MICNLYLFLNHNVIRPYHLKKCQNPYWIRTIRTRWHVCLLFTLFRPLCPDFFCSLMLTPMHRTSTSTAISLLLRVQLYCWSQAYVSDACATWATCNVSPDTYDFDEWEQPPPGRKTVHGQPCRFVKEKIIESLTQNHAIGLRRDKETTLVI